MISLTYYLVATKTMNPAKETRATKRKHVDQSEYEPTHIQDLMNAFAIAYIQKEGEAISSKQKLNEIRNSSIKTISGGRATLTSLCDTLKDMLKIILDYQERFSTFKGASARKKEGIVAQMEYRAATVRKELKESLGNLKVMGTGTADYTRTMEEMLGAIDAGWVDTTK